MRTITFIGNENPADIIIVDYDEAQSFMMNLFKNTLQTSARLGPVTGILDDDKFIDELKSKIKIPLELVDERLSSKAADALTGNKKTKFSRDAISAMIILQSYLDKM